MTIFKAISISPKLVDGADAKERLRRNALFEISGMRGQYPQFFVANESGEIKFLGGFDDLEMWNDCATLQEQIKRVQSR